MSLIPAPELEAAYAAVARLSEEQRLALATQLIVRAEKAVSILQLRRAASAATTTADSLEKLDFAERAARSVLHGFRTSGRM